MGDRFKVPETRYVQDNWQHQAGENPDYVALRLCDGAFRFVKTGVGVGELLTTFLTPGARCGSQPAAHERFRASSEEAVQRYIAELPEAERERTFVRPIRADITPWPNYRA